jgi:hypothetical protein
MKILSNFDCVDDNLSEVESSGSDNEVGDNQESDRKICESDSEHVMGKWLQLSVYVM